MPYFDNEGVKIHYEIEGQGPDLIMIHGFAASIEYNWRQANWIETLKEENRLILLDCRGHGKSEKPRSPDQYGEKMADDIVKLMEHLAIKKANFFGYSMGSRLTLQLMLREPERLNCAILGGFVLPPDNQHSIRRATAVIHALKAASMEKIEDDIGREFRRFAQATGADLEALAAVMEASSREQSASGHFREALKRIKMPVLTVVGSDDFLPGDPTAFAKLIPGACHFQIQGKDHLTVVPDPRFHMVVRAFLNYINGK
ncbi:MAG: alpha/beta hydrolase [Deltaproteobacteria bacterium]|nr:alpha/beta hydrolase [Deltaproteobacteria bacterium]